MIFETNLAPKKTDIEEVRKILMKYNRQFFKDVTKEDFAITVKDEEQTVIAGITGSIFGEWMEIEYLAVEEAFRNHGFGRQLLEKAEALAIEHHCKHLLLYTFDFQGVNYYPKFGFKEIFQIENFPITGSEHWFVKEI